MSAAAAASKSRDRAEQTAKDSPWVPRLARAGLVTRGLLHVVVGWLAIRVASGDQGRRADQQGALATLVRQPMGRVLVLALALGFLSYAAWRFVEAALDPEDKGTLKRIGCGLRGLLYVGLFASAMRLVVGGASKGGGGSSKQQDETARVLEWPFGRWLVMAVGLAVIGIGMWNGWRAVTRKFEKDLKRYEMSGVERTWTTRLGMFGHIARMVAYGVAGFFLVRAGVRFEPHKGVGLDASLHELAGRSYGPWMLGAVGVGLIAFGVYQFALARYRQILGD
ncbi:MAG TPA: DUF1206 domain-containing protein [Acidimicrobiales bacterium]|nr:DUF1206 domain-containing protein [Acidimicrobiales bacterium]